MSDPYDLAIDRVGRMSLSELANTAAGYTPPRSRDARGRFVSRQTASPGAVTSFLTSTPTSRRTVSSSGFRDVAANAAETPMWMSQLEERQLPSGAPPQRVSNRDRIRAALRTTPLDPARALFQTQAATLSARTRALLTTPSSDSTPLSMTSIQTLRDTDGDVLSDWMKTLPVKKRKEFVSTFGSLVARDIPTAIELFQESDKQAYRRVTSLPSGTVKSSRPMR